MAKDIKKDTVLRVEKTFFLSGEKELRTVLLEARDTELATLGQASTLECFMRYTTAIRELTPERYMWAIKEFSKRTVGDWIGDYEEPEVIQRFDDEAVLARSLYKLAVEKPCETDKARVVIQEINHRSHPNLTEDVGYRAIAILPSPTSREQPQVVYMNFKTGCTLGSASCLVGSSRLVSFDIHDYNVEQLATMKDEPTGDETFDHQVWIMVAMKGLFGNEDERYLVSNFVQTQLS